MGGGGGDATVYRPVGPLFPAGSTALECAPHKAPERPCRGKCAASPWQATAAAVVQALARLRPNGKVHRVRATPFNAPLMHPLHPDGGSLAPLEHE